MLVLEISLGRISYGTGGHLKVKGNLLWVVHSSLNSELPTTPAFKVRANHAVSCELSLKSKI